MQSKFVLFILIVFGIRSFPFESSLIKIINRKVRLSTMSSSAPASKNKDPTETGSRKTGLVFDER